MRILVIGGSGFIGQYVSRALVREGHDVAVMHRGRENLAKRVPGGASVLNSHPLSSPAAMEKALSTNPERVVHMLAMTEADAQAATSMFAGKIGRLVFASSGDVYRAYGRFIRSEPGPVEPMPLSATTSPLRTRLYPYRVGGTPPESLAHAYDKVLVERVFMVAPGFASVCLRLPKVYGRENNRFETVYRFANYPDWRWTHGYVENVAAAIALAVLHPAAAGRTYNVGERETPTISERLAHLPPSALEPVSEGAHDFTQDIVYDTEPIRAELGYREVISWEEGRRRTLAEV